MSRAIAAARPSIESAVVAGHQPTPQPRKQKSQKLINLPRQSKLAKATASVNYHSARPASSHPDCRAVLIQIVARYLNLVSLGGELYPWRCGARVKESRSRA